MKSLNSSFFFYCNLASIIATSITYCMIYMPCAAIWANSQCRCYCNIMSSSFCCSCLRLSSFRMCHFTIFLINYYLSIVLNHSNEDRPDFRQLLRRYLPLPHYCLRQTFRQKPNVSSADRTFPCCTCPPDERASSE